MYQDNVSDERLDIIIANECEYHVHELATRRFRRLANEIELRDARIASLSAQLNRLMNGELE